MTATVPPTLRVMLLSMVVILRLLEKSPAQRFATAVEYRAGDASGLYGAPAAPGSGMDRVDGQRLLDEALQTAFDNSQACETSDLLYSRFEGRRCLAEVRT